MESNHISRLAAWADLLTRSDIPVLRQTARELDALRQDANRLSARNVAEAIAADPMLTAKLLRYLQQHKRRSQTSEVVQVEQALLMLGVGTFYDKVPATPHVQDTLQGQTNALVELLRVIHRASRASEYARDWAIRLNDMHYEEVRVAALLHDLAEMLLWCYAPEDMLKIRALQQHDRTLRSRAVQEQVLGFSLPDLQKLLVGEWNLPQLLLDLMDDATTGRTRVRCVTLAGNLARHSANGWDDAALPDDYRELGELLRIPAEAAMALVLPEGGKRGS